MSKNLTKLSDQQLLNRQKKGIRTALLLALIFVGAVTIIVLSLVYPDSFWWTITEARATSVIRPMPLSLPILATVFSAYGTVVEIMKLVAIKKNKPLVQLHLQSKIRRSRQNESKQKAHR